MGNDMTPLGFYKWFPRDFYMSGTVKSMTFMGRAIYRELLDYQWENGRLTNVERMLNVLGVSLNDFENHFAEYMEELFPNGQNPRLNALREEALAKSQKASKAGKASGESRKSGSKSNTKGTGVKRTLNKRSTNAEQTLNQTETETETETDINSYEFQENSPVKIDPKKDSPFERIAQVLEKINGDRPAQRDIMRHMKETQPLRRLVDSLGVEGTLRIHSWALENWKSTPTWSGLWEQRGSIKQKMGDVPPPVIQVSSNEPVEGVDFQILPNGETVDMDGRAWSREGWYASRQRS